MVSPLGIQNDSWCLEMNYSEIIHRNLTQECRNVFSGPTLPSTFMATIQIFYALVCVVGLCGNTLVIYVVLRYSKMQTVTYIYILMLAVADEIFLIGIPFLIVTTVQGDWIFGMAMCKIYLTTTSINQFTSSIFLTVLSADRYIAVCHPISAPKYRTTTIARCVSLSAWTASALLMVPVFMYAATITKPQGGQSCNIFWPFEEDEDDGDVDVDPVTQPSINSDPKPHVLNGQTAFTFYSFFLGFAIPLFLILIFYVQVIIKLKTVGPKNTKTSKGKKKSHAKVTRLVLTVITVYIFCWLPYWTTQLSLIFTPPGQNQGNIMVAVMLLAGCLSYSNSAMNPILYAFLSENFKKSFLKACTCSNRRDANAALQIEPSLFPRRRTLGASTKSKLQNHDRTKENKVDGITTNGPSGENYEMKRLSIGAKSRSSKSCCTSTICATGTTSLGNNGNPSMVVAVNCGNIILREPNPTTGLSCLATLNGNLTPPPQSV